MENFKRYGFPKGSLSEDNAIKKPDVVHGSSVPNEFLETKDRKRLNRVLNFGGIIGLVLVACVPVICFLYVIYPYPDWLLSYFKYALIGVAVFCHLGFIFEAAANNTEQGWFPLATGICWIYVIITVIIMLIGQAVH